MLDAVIVKHLIAEIRNQLVTYGIDTNDLRVARSFQPTSQNTGINKPYQVFVAPVSSGRVGWGREYSTDSSTVTHTKIKSYQVSVLTEFDPSTMTVIPAHDVAEIIGDMMQQPDATASLRANGVSVVSCSDVRPAFDLNKSQDWQSMPSLDIAVCVESVYTKQSPAVADVRGELDNL